MFKTHPIEPGSQVRLTTIDAGATPGWQGGKSKALAAGEELARRLHTLQALLWGEGRRKVLVVLQGMDTSGKDGTISSVFEGVNPLGVKVAAFKAPSADELAHDFLWRVHARVPAAGEIAIFNRSHYEAVLVERVHELVPHAVWAKRYAQINDFERLLAESGTTVLKFFLHIDRDEQGKRLEARLANPEKRWKLRPEDVDDRRRWDAFAAAYEEAIERTAQPYAPWWIVPANKKWYRNLVVASVLVHALEQMDPELPPPVKGLKGLRIP